jgi:hypothetical protein
MKLNQNNLCLLTKDNGMPFLATDIKNRSSCVKELFKYAEKNIYPENELLYTILELEKDIMTSISVFNIPIDIETKTKKWIVEFFNYYFKLST